MFPRDESSNTQHPPANSPKFTKILVTCNIQIISMGLVFKGGQQGQHPTYVPTDPQPEMRLSHWSVGMEAWGTLRYLMISLRQIKSIISALQFDPQQCIMSGILLLPSFFPLRGNHSRWPQTCVKRIMAFQMSAKVKNCQ